MDGGHRVVGEVLLGAAGAVVSARGGVAGAVVSVLVAVAGAEVGAVGGEPKDGSRHDAIYELASLIYLSCKTCETALQFFVGGRI